MWTVGERPQYVGATTTLNRQVDAGKCRLRAYLAHSARTGAQGCGQRWWEAIPAGLLEGGVAPSHGVSGVRGAPSQRTLDFGGALSHGASDPLVWRHPTGSRMPVRRHPMGSSRVCGALSQRIHKRLWDAVPRCPHIPWSTVPNTKPQVIDACASEVPRSQSPQRPHSSPTGGIGGSPSQGRRPTWLGIPEKATALPTSPLSRPI